MKPLDYAEAHGTIDFFGIRETNRPYEWYEVNGPFKYPTVLITARGCIEKIQAPEISRRTLPSPVHISSLPCW